MFTVTCAHSAQVKIVSKHRYPVQGLTMHNESGRDLYTSVNTLNAVKRIAANGLSSARKTGRPLESIVTRVNGAID